MTEPTVHEAAGVLAEMVATLAGTGRHADHVRTQVGRCVHCSCGARVQGRLPAGTTDAGGAPVFEVVLPDGFVSYRTNSRELADDRARQHPGAVVRQAGSR